MPYRHTDGEPPAKRFNETTDPRNPPHAIVHPGARRTAVRTYLGIIVATFAIVAALFFFFWASPDDGAEPDEAIGTTGDLVPRGETPGGFDADPDLDSTREELEYRGAGDPYPRPLPTVTTEPLRGLDAVRGEPARGFVGRRIELTGVEVERVAEDRIWIRHGGETIAVLTPGAANVRGGQRVDVQGTIEQDGDQVRIRADRVGAAR